MDIQKFNQSVDQSTKFFKNMELGLQPHEIGEIINAVCANVEKEAQANAPYVTGTLRNSIVHWMNNEFSGEVGAMASYAAAVEFGYTNKLGKKVPGRKYFTPAAIHGRQMLIDELLKYTVALTKGQKPKPIAGPRGSKRSPVVHKYTSKSYVGGRVRYKYAKDKYTVTSFRLRLHPSGRQQKYGFKTRYAGAQR